MTALRCILFALLPVLAARGAYTEFYVQPSGSNLNAGSSSSNGAALTYTSIVAANGWNASTGVFTVGSGTPNSDMASMADGTHFASVYVTAGATVATFVGRITGVSSTTITVSLTNVSGTPPATDATGATTLKVDGAWAGPNSTTGFPWGFAATTMTNSSGNVARVNIKTGTPYAWETAVTHSNAGPLVWEGYTTTLGDGGIPEFTGAGVASGTPFAMLNITGSGNVLRSLWFRDNYLAPQAGAQSTGNFILQLTSHQNYLYRVKVSGGYRGGLLVAGSGGAGGSVLEECAFFDNQYDDANLFGNLDIDEECAVIRCTITGSARVMRAGAAGTQSAGVDLNNASGEPVLIIDSVIADNQGDGILSAGNGNATIFNTLFIRNGLSGTGDGIDLTTTTLTAVSLWLVANCIFEDNDDYGIRNDGVATGFPRLTNNGFYSNGSGETLNINSSFITGSISFSGSPFVDSASGDWRLNNTSGAGAAARGAGASGFLIGGAAYSAGSSTLGYRDVGAVQHQDSGGGGGSETATSFIR